MKNTELNTIFLIGSPEHTNLGDHAMIFCIRKLLYDLFPTNYVIKEVTQTECNNKDFIKLLRDKIQTNDKIFFTGGYHLTDVYRPKLFNAYSRVIQNFKDHEIIVFPQTIFFRDKLIADVMSSVFNSHGKIILMCRDKDSYEIAKKYFTNCKLYLFPDIVTSLIGSKDYNNDNREGVLLCIRKDKESIDKNFNNSIIKDMFNCTVDEFSNILDVNLSYFSNHQETIINNIIEKFSKYKVIITDRFHTIVFSLISNTPVIVLPSNTHKVKSGMKMFYKQYKSYIRFTDNITDIPKLFNELMNEDNKKKTIQYFNSEYLPKIKKIILND